MSADLTPRVGDVWRGPVLGKGWNKAEAAPITITYVSNARIYYRTSRDAVWGITPARWRKWAATATLVSREGANG